MTRKDEEILKEFGKHLQKLRVGKELSTREFAKKSMISHSSVGRLEAGLSNPALTTLIKLAKALNIDLNTLAQIK
jgi:transcriptional regulator with XRE-family HTH domain